MNDNTLPKVVKALYNFKPKNTDELPFSKGDLITLTQVVEGGWWEGTLDDKTGWFPSNYVKEVKSDGRAGAKSPKPGDLAMNKRESMAFYHNVVLQSLIDTERNLVTELQSLLQSFLRPLQSSNICSQREYKHLVGNLEEIAVLHQNLLSNLDECAKQVISQQRIGGLFLKHAPQLQNLYKEYCSNHPLAVQVLQAYRDQLNVFMENNGAQSPGIRRLTTSVSLPFTRLDKYPNLLKELQRHTEESHPDRGDTQRAISVYRDIATVCMDIRRQKELEQEIMNSPIKGWEGEEIYQLGEVLLMSHVKVHLESGDKKDRLFVLFHGLLVMISISPRMSGYIYEGKIPMNGLSINALEDTDNVSNALEISGKSMDKLTVSCASTSDQQRWIEALKTQSHAPAHSKISSTSQANMKPVAPPQAKTTRVVTHHTSHHQPQAPPLMNPLPLASRSTSVTTTHLHTNTASGGGGSPSVPLHTGSIPMAGSKGGSISAASTMSGSTTQWTWSLSCLRPSPPFRPQMMSSRDAGDGSRSPKGGRRLLGSYRKKPVDDHKSLEEDALILKVIEAYCTSAKARHTVNSLDLRKLRVSERANMLKAALLDSPHVLIAEDEKIIVEEVKGDEVVVEEKSLVDTVYQLRDEVRLLKDEQSKMKKDLDDETKARKKLENYLRKSLLSISDTKSSTFSTDIELGGAT